MRYRSERACSSESSDGLIDHGHSVGTVLEVDSLPLVVHVVLVVDLTVNDWGHHVYEEENGDGGEDQSHEITGETDIDHTVALEGAESLPQSLVVRGRGKWSLLLAEAWDVKIDTGAQLSFDLETFDHLNNLTLLLVSLGVVRANLPQVLVDVVLHYCYLFYEINKNYNF